MRKQLWYTSCLAAAAMLAVGQNATAQQDEAVQPRPRDTENAPAREGVQLPPNELGQPATDPRQPRNVAPGQQRGATEGAAANEQQQRRAELGIALAPSRGDGVLVSSVRPGGAADRAGIQPGDYITQFDGQQVSSPRNLTEILMKAEPDTQISVTIWRNGEEQQLDVKPMRAGRMTGFRGMPQNERRGDTAWLGVSLSEEQSERGVEIIRTFPSGPASRANLRTGDVILSINGQDVATPDAVIEAVEQAQPNEEAKIVVLRNNAEREMNVRLGSRNTFLGDDRMGEFGDEGDEDMDDERMHGYGDVPQHAMLLEFQRRQAQHIQRLEGMILNLTQEVQALRQDMGGAPRENRPGRPNTGAAAPPR